MTVEINRSHFYDLVRDQLKQCILAVPHSPAPNPWMHWDVDEREEGVELTGFVMILTNPGLHEVKLSVSVMVDHLAWRGER